MAPKNSKKYSGTRKPRKGNNVQKHTLRNRSKRKPRKGRSARKLVLYYCNEP